MAELPRDPTLDAGDAVLRPLRPSDAGELSRLRSDADVMRWSQPDGCTPEEATAAIAEADEAWRAGRRAELAIADRADDLLLGTISLTLYDATRASVGFDVVPEARGRGLATRSVTALTEWAFRTFPELVRIELWALPGNTASMRVAERTGFRREGVFRARLPFAGELRDVVVFSRLRTD